MPKQAALRIRAGVRAILLCCLSLQVDSRVLANQCGDTPGIVACAACHLPDSMSMSLPSVSQRDNSDKNKFDFGDLVFLTNDKKLWMAVYQVVGVPGDVMHYTVNSL